MSTRTAARCPSRSATSIEPQDIIKESGAEILRLWVAMVDYREEVRSARRSSRASSRRTGSCGTRCASSPRTSTTSIRRPTCVPVEPLEAVDRYALARYGTAARRCSRLRGVRLPECLPGAEPARDRRSERVLRRRLEGSPVHARAPDSPSGARRRRRCTSSRDGLARLLAPILPVTAESCGRHLPGDARGVGPPRRFPDDVECARSTADADGRWERLLTIRDAGQRGARRAAQGEGDRQLARGAGHAARRAARSRAAATQYRTTADAVHRLGRGALEPATADGGAARSRSSARTA